MAEDAAPKKKRGWMRRFIPTSLEGRVALVAAMLDAFSAMELASSDLPVFAKLKA